MTTKTKKVAVNKKTTETNTETRKVTIWSTQERATQTIETSAKTWGELKKELSNVGNTRAVIRETSNTLESGGAKLPDQDFTLFLYPVAQVEGYKQEFSELMDSLRPSKAKELSKADQKLALEAAELAEELSM